ncbi:MAG: HlyD family efflux transporter periplasmic adaptor subunit [Firmicutes bacterium]|nr:HlyD family efflux transporter periplasmic adaptor subunit [Bacillota bacterium]
MDRKKKIKKMILQYFGIILVLTIFSHSINNLALPKVEIIKPRSKSLQFNIQKQGTITPKSCENIYAKFPITVEKIFIKPNKIIKKGEKLVKLDKKELYDLFIKKEGNYKKSKLKYQISKLQNKNKEDLETEKLNFEKERREIQRKEVLYENGAISKKKLEDALDLFKRAKIQYEYKKKNEPIEKLKKEYNLVNNELQYKLNKFKYEDIKRLYLNKGIIKSPINGIVKSIDIREGEKTNKKQSIVQITDPSLGYEFKFSLRKNISRYIKIGDKLKVSFKGVDDFQLECKIINISNDKMEPNKLKEITLYIKSGRLKGDEVAIINEYKSTKKYNIVLPNTAIGEANNGKKFVWTIRSEDKAFGREYYVNKRYITIGESDLENTVITSGLKRFEEIVKNITELNLKEDARVLKQ